MGLLRDRLLQNRRSLAGFRRQRIPERLPTGSQHVPAELCYLPVDVIPTHSLRI